VNSFGILFFMVAAVGLVSLPRNWAIAPLLFGACYMTLGQGLEIGPFSFTVIRMLILVGLIRIVVRGERLPGGMGQLDWVVVTFGLWVILSSFGHANMTEAITFRLGKAYNAIGTYFLVRILCNSAESIRNIPVVLAIVLFPVALSMFIEHHTGRNLFSFLGGVPEVSQVREGRIRAQGPFLHPILAGTVGAASIPIVLILWRRNRHFAILGLVGCALMIYGCSSSGPIMTALAGLFGVTLYRFPRLINRVGIKIVGIYIVLAVLMKAPVYYLIARVDIIGGSTGHHRARLIEQGIAHLNEWWLVGTDYTRHWMPTGVIWSPDHSDITNHYLHLGVVGGLLSMILFIFILRLGFVLVGRSLRFTGVHSDWGFAVWCLGSALFAHTITFVSVSYFDQSIVFLYLLLGAIGSLGELCTQRRIINCRESLSILESGDHVRLSGRFLHT
jgi:hypothetical protein